MQGADPAAGPAYCEKSRTESEGQARPLFLPWREALARPKRRLGYDPRCLRVTHCKNWTFLSVRRFPAGPGTRLSRAKNCTFLHNGCRTLLRIRENARKSNRSPYELPATVRSLPGRK